MQQYVVSSTELKQIQNIEKEMLAEVDRICRKHGLHYNMVGGTMLGAVRHRGFIPWDDDADIAMLRDTYDKFIKLCETELDSDRFYFQDIHCTEGYRWGYGKIRRKDTQFIRYGQEDMPYEQGVFIDIFPMDSVPDGRICQKIHSLQCYFLRKMLWSKVGKNLEKNFVKKTIYSLWSVIPMNKLRKRYDLLVDKGRNKRTEMVRILTFPAPKGTCGFYRRWYENHSYYRFEDIQLEGAEDYEGWLQYKFGDYMRLPSEEQRKIHPISSLKLLSKEDENEKEI